MRGTAQNPDVFFQAREACNTYYEAVPGIVQETMDKFAQIVGRQYHLFDYVGAPDAEHVIVVMGSGAETAEETVNYLVARGEKVGLLKVHLYRPFSIEYFMAAVPASVKRCSCTLDRTKEPGASGEPLYQDCVTAVMETGRTMRVIGGRYGLSSKEFTPAMVKAVFDNMAAPRRRTTSRSALNDDVTFTSLPYDAALTWRPRMSCGPCSTAWAPTARSARTRTRSRSSVRRRHYGAQGYFVYDSKKSGATLPTRTCASAPGRSTRSYLIQSANFIACHQWVFLERYNMLANAAPGATFLLNSVYGPDEVWDHLPRIVQAGRSSTRSCGSTSSMLTKWPSRPAWACASTPSCRPVSSPFPACCRGTRPSRKIKKAINKTYGKRGETWWCSRTSPPWIIRWSHLYEVNYPGKVHRQDRIAAGRGDEAPEFVQQGDGPDLMASKGDSLPVSQLPVDGTFPTATTQWEKRNIALEIPVWDASHLHPVQQVCPGLPACGDPCQGLRPGHLSSRRPATFKASGLQGAVRWPARSIPCRWRLRTAPAARLCIDACPAKNKADPQFKALNLTPQPPLRDSERENFAFFLGLPELDRTAVPLNSVKNSQLLQPLFEFSGACAGCGETPYVKLVSQLFGDRAVVANATGCSSIYGGNLPTTPWSVNKDGRGPAWSNSLFEDNAEFGLGFRLTLDKQTEFARELVHDHAGVLGAALAEGLLTADQSSEKGIAEQRAQVGALKHRLSGHDEPWARQLASLADVLVKRSVWIMGGDGWAYDIGYGGLDHVLASGRNVNVLVLDTQVYSNTGGQASKATPRAAVARFAAAGKALPKKDLGLIAMTYGNIYVAQVAMGANDAQTVRAILEAEAYDGPSLIIAYSHCIASKGSNMTCGLSQQKLAVDSGAWVLYRYNPLLPASGKNPLALDSKAPKIPLKDYIYKETRYSSLAQVDEERAEKLLQLAQQDVLSRWNQYEQLAAVSYEQA